MELYEPGIAALSGNSKGRKITFLILSFGSWCTSRLFFSTFNATSRKMQWMKGAMLSSEKPDIFLLSIISCFYLSSLFKSNIPFKKFRIFAFIWELFLLYPLV